MLRVGGGRSCAASTCRTICFLTPFVSGTGVPVGIAASGGPYERMACGRLSGIRHRIGPGRCRRRTAHQRRHRQTDRSGAGGAGDRAHDRVLADGVRHVGGSSGRTHPEGRGRRRDCGNGRRGSGPYDPGGFDGRDSRRRQAPPLRHRPHNPRALRQRRRSPKPFPAARFGNRCAPVARVPRWS